jgi:hypothetical protein
MTCRPVVVLYSSDRGNGKGKAIPLQAWTGPEVEVPIFHDSRLMKVVRSALRSGRLYLAGNISSTHFC